MKQRARSFTCQAMFCGTSSFSDDDPSSSPKAPKRKSHRSKNPYSSRGLDKFTSVLSELEAKREKIMATAGEQGISMIRFMYSNSHDWIPIVVRIRDDRNSNDKQIVPAAVKKPEEVPTTSTEKRMDRRMSIPSTATATAALPWWKWRSGYFMPAMMVLILICLAVFGRVFAICCTSIWWYAAPSLKSDERMKKRVARKKEYVKRFSDKRMLELGSPRGGNNNGRKQ